MRGDAATVGGAPNLVGDVGIASEEVTARATVGAGRPESGDITVPAFDYHHPPDMELIDDCVHCGFCLPTCPTYLLFGEEMDSPRGRIYLMREGLEGEPMTDAMVRHFDLCLGCLSCVTACPSGVQYEKLIEATRQQVERRYERTRGDRLFRELIFRIFPYPARLRVLAAGLKPYHRLGLRGLFRASGLQKLLSDRLKTLEELTPDPPKTGALSKVAPFTPAAGTRRRVVGLLTGCVQRVFFPHVNAATVRVLAAEGCDVVAPKQGCCGALSLHAGREEEGMAFARRTIDTFEAAGVENIVANVAGCGSAMKEYGHLLRDDPEYAERAAAFSKKVRDASELIHELGPVAPRHPLPVVAAYHDACHLAHGQGIRAQPRELLRAIPGMELRNIQESEICCGSAGIYNLVEPEPAAQLGERKAANILKTGAKLLVTANPGCLLQIRASLERMGESVPLAHPMEVVDASIRGQPLDSIL
ncbi:MAG: 4Fe-4S dicluster domain-containing protein [Gemmatimonadetes bacterium]|nr:4Fe-4S dicluster domain-containing protein [Gemmatimonadota bacterium]